MWMNFFFKGEEVMKSNYCMAYGKRIMKDGTIVRESYVLREGIPFYSVNEWLEGYISSTRKTYCSRLNVFLRYLDSRNLEYYQVNIKTLYAFFKYLILYEDSQDIFSLNKSISYGTLRGYQATLTEYYRFRENIKQEKILDLKTTQKKNNKYNFLYGQIGSSKLKKVFDKYINNISEKKDYIKWYTDDDIDILFNSFKTLRDKAIFLISVQCGFRIDEILSIKLQDYSNDNRIVRISRSKTTTRSHKISKELSNLIDRYILTERYDAEIYSGKINEYLFINIRRDKYCGEEISYTNIIGIFKRTAKKAGYDPNQIRTHSGRSTKVMELLYLQSESNNLLTDHEITETMGLSNTKGLEPYKNKNDERYASLIGDKIVRIKKKKYRDKW
jgi:integrase/recombinase XerD